jgi:hypothetical protein
MLLYAPILAAALPALAAQPVSSDPPPVDVELLTVQTSGGETQSLRARNVSSKDVSAYVALMPNDAGPCCLTRTTVLATAKPPRDRLRPGETREDPPVPAAAMAAKPALRATVDYVLFADGSSWGPDTQHQSGSVRGLIQGTRATLARLKRILDTQGSGAVIKALNSQQP